MDPTLIVQIWDNNKFRKDSYIGQLALDLLSFDGNNTFIFITIGIDLEDLIYNHISQLYLNAK